MSTYAAPSDPPLDWPAYGIGPIAAVRQGLRKYATFGGRASRSEYWWFVLGTIVILLVLALLAVGLGILTSPGPVRPDGGRPIGIGGIIMLILLGACYLALVIPSLAVSVRRLHDAGYSGWFVLFNLFPYVGGLVVVVFCALPTSPTAARFGPPGTPPPALGPAHPWADPYAAGTTESDDDGYFRRPQRPPEDPTARR